jgi:hypothetical protein
MKAEKRHQLQTNVLADHMGRFVQTMKTAPTSTSVLVWVFTILVLVTFAVWQIASSVTRASNSDLWTEVDAATRDFANGPETLKKLADENRGTIAGRTARFQLSRRKLQDGQAGLSSFDPLGAIEKMHDARKLYQELAGECVDMPLLAQEALMMVAVVDESLVGITTPDDPRADLQHALKSYEKLAKEFPDSILGEKAAARAEELRAAIERGEEEKPSDIEKFYAEQSQRITRRMQPPETTPQPPKEPPKPEAKVESAPESKPEPKKPEPQTESKTESKTKK